MSGLATSILFTFYGLAFFVMGVSVLLSAEYRSDLFYTRHTGWLACFGLLFGLSGFVVGQAAISTDPGLSLPILVLRTAGLAFFLEYGRRLWNHGQRWRVPFWLPLLYSALVVFIVVFVSDDTHAGLDAAERFLIILPLTWLIAWTISLDSRICQAEIKVLGGEPWLRLLQLSYLLFGMMSLILVLPLQSLPWLPTNSKFRVLVGFRVQVLHTAIACTIALCHFMLARLTVRMASRRNDENMEVIRQRTEEMLASKNAAEKANAAKSEFLSRMSHELRTPLNAIMGFSQLLGMEASQGNAKQQEYLRHIVTACNHLLSLVNELLDLSRVESGKLQLSLESLSLGSLVDSAIRQIMPLAVQRRLAVTCPEPAADQSLYVRADKTRVLQVLLNLLGNAVKYNRVGGNIVVGLEAGDSMVRISISDTGHGIAARDFDRLFQPFERLGQGDYEVEGTGIGLAFTRHLVEAMQGRIGVSSEEGSGSTFWIELPRSHEVPQELPPHAMGTKLVHDETVNVINVLLVEDNPLNVLLIEKFLASKPKYRLHSAESAELGLEMAARLQPDLILMDINLPGMDGFAALRALKADSRTADIPVLAVSANGMQEQVTRGRLAGFVDYLVKPLDLAVLLQKIDYYGGSARS